MTTRTPSELLVFYGISSPWAYFGAPRVREIAAKHGACVVLRPIRVIEANGGIPPRTRGMSRNGRPGSPRLR
jgi:2-hydroxychromene-2-carboxylate isomerase